MKRTSILSSSILTRSLAALALCTAAIGPAQAALVDFTLSGTVSAADAGNPFGLSASDSVLVSGRYDDAAVAPSGGSDLVFGAGSGNLMTLFFGTISLTEAMDELFGPGTGASLSFLDGDLVGIAFSAVLGTHGAPINLLASAGGWNGWEDSFVTTVTGDFDLGGFDTAAVPVPATWLLLAPALLAFGARRARA